MDQANLPNWAQRVLTISSVLIFISTFIVVLIGNSSGKINNEVKELQLFLVNTESIQTNFEKSLQMYTQGTQEIIDYLFSLRPAKEADYINFISMIEEIEQKYSLQITLQSHQDKSGTKKTTGDNEETLDYQISFYGNTTDLNKFLSELENLPYFIRVEKINFVSHDSLDSEKNTESPNITLFIKLYINL